jgi:hypothetical protein
MLSLIAREIRDNIVSVALPCLVSAIGMTLAIVFAFSGFRGGGLVPRGGFLAPTGMVIPVLLLAFGGLGASQAYGDRANRISSLLATLGVTRTRIFAARVLAGLLVVLVSLVPLAVTTILLLWMFMPPLEFYGRMVVEISLTLLLAAAACYFAGLLVGWTTSKSWLLAGNVLLLLFPMSLVVIKGFGRRPDEKLGRFLAPVAERFVLDPQVVYDRAVRRFYAVDWFHRTVRKGPQLPEDKTYRPVQIRVLAKNLQTPLILPFAPLKGNRRDQVLWPAYFWVKDLALVLDASGRIDLLDPQTLHFVGVAGRLMSPAFVFGPARQTGPEDVIAYEVSLIGLPGGDGSKGWTYGGCAMATVSRDVAGMRLEVYDANGRSVASDETHIPQYVEAADGRIMAQGSIPSVRAVYSRLPGAQVLTLIKFALESLHPPVLLALSHWAAPHLEASAGYRSIFLLPDSFVAMSARDAGIGMGARFFRACLLVCPAVLLALLLAWLVIRDGTKMGLSKNARVAWVAGAMAFGLPAYITYRLTRPRVTLVTCANCGVGRRPDLEKCQRCGSPWVVPELVPPAWRVLGEQEPAAESSSSELRQANSSAQ